MRSFFITGTDTDSGKTFVTAGVTSALRRKGIDAVPAKPVQTGCVNGVAQDLEYSLKLSGLKPGKAEKERLCPLRYAPACSPHLAAELAGEKIDTGLMTKRLEELRRKHHCVIAEGAGGVLVPLGRGRTMLDLMGSLGWPVILVVRDRLGVINHALLSIQAITQRRIPLAGIIFNHADPPCRLISESNLQTILRYGRTKLLGEIPYSPDSFPEKEFDAVCGKLELAARR